MSSISKEDLVGLINLLGGKEEEEKGKVDIEKIREEERQKLIDEAKAAQQAEDEGKTQKENPKEEEGKEENSEEKTQEQDDREVRYIEKSLATQLTGKGVDSDVLESLSEYIAYDTLKNEEGEADEEKIESFAELISNVANRKPPKAKRSSALDDDGGLAKYLQKK